MFILNKPKSEKVKFFVAEAQFFSTASLLKIDAKNICSWRSASFLYKTTGKYKPFDKNFDLYFSIVRYVLRLDRTFH